ncbi:MAG: GNAT family N-acetyltransferase [Oscillospiraceae bacterium]|nr:GNAT family N-acetyltransferase [Oscillospiraceae bacterium]
MDKNGKELILRNAELSDAADLIRYLKVITAETPYLIRKPEEITLTEEQERKFIQSKIADERELMLLGFVDGKHVGNCSLMRAGGFHRYRHRCEVGIALYQAYCGRGIGFRKYGTFPNDPKYQNGSYADGYWMMKKL